MTRAVLFDFGDTLFRRAGEAQGIVEIGGSQDTPVEPTAAEAVWSASTSPRRVPRRLPSGAISRPRLTAVNGLASSRWRTSSFPEWGALSTTARSTWRSGFPTRIPSSRAPPGSWSIPRRGERHRMGHLLRFLDARLGPIRRLVGLVIRARDGEAGSEPVRDGMCGTRRSPRRRPHGGGQHDDRRRRRRRQTSGP